MLISTAKADEWTLTAGLNQGIEYDDNINLSSNPVMAFGYKMLPRFDAGWNTRTRKIGVTGQADIRRYDDEQWDCDNFSFALNQNYLHKRHTFTVPFNYAQSCSYAQQDVDTGVLVPNNNSETWSISPSLSWEWGKIDTVRLGFNYEQSSFSSVNSGLSQEGSANFNDNTTYSVNLSEQHVWSRRLSSNISMFASRSDFTNFGRSSRQAVFGFQVGGQYSITREWTVNAGGGLQWVDSPGQSSVDDSENDSLLRTEVLNISVSYQGRRNTFSSGFSRSVSPSASGQLLESNSLEANYSYQYNSKLTLDLDGSIRENESVGQGLSQQAQKRRFFQISPSLTWSIDRRWQLIAKYRFRRQEFDNDDTLQSISTLNGTRDSNSFMININYNWDGIRISQSQPFN